MTLRTQQNRSTGKDWTLDELRDGFVEFYKEHGHYPTSQEIDTYQYLPSSRLMQRKYGGLVALRKSLGLDGQDDYRTGAHSTERALKIGRRANETEHVVHNYLSERFSKEFVHREFFFNDDARTRVDFFVYDADGNFCVDVFYPSDYRNLIGCLNSKQGKYINSSYPTIFLQMNPDITQEQVDKLLMNKKNKQLKNQYVMGWQAFEKFCADREPRRLI